MICSFIVMKCEGFSMISDLVDYLHNNLLIAHFCGFDISRPLPSYWTFDRFLLFYHGYIWESIEIRGNVSTYVLEKFSVQPELFYTLPSFA